jgi:hypothetical protein
MYEIHLSMFSLQVITNCKCGCKLNYRNESSYKYERKRSFILNMLQNKLYIFICNCLVLSRYEHEIFMKYFEYPNSKLGG